MNAPVTITFKGLDPSPALDARIRELAGRLDHVCRDIVRCEVLVETPHRRHRQGKRFHVRIAMTVPGSEIVVSHDPGAAGAHEDPRVAVRDSFSAARRQLEDYVRARHEVGAAPAA